MDAPLNVWNSVRHETLCWKAVSAHQQSSIPWHSQKHCYWKDLNEAQSQMYSPKRTGKNKCSFCHCLGGCLTSVIFNLSFNTFASQQLFKLQLSSIISQQKLIICKSHIFRFKTPPAIICTLWKTLFNVPKLPFFITHISKFVSSCKVNNMYTKVLLFTHVPYLASLRWK